MKVAETTGYGTKKKQVKIVLTTRMKLGTVINELLGKTVELDKDEEKFLTRNCWTSYSLMKIESKSGNKTYLMLGTAELLNHSCTHNAKFILLKGKYDVGIQIVRHVSPGEELTLYYGPHFFWK